MTIHFSTDRVVGNGSFGVVFQATCLETNELVAIKKVLQDRRFKNRELQARNLLSLRPGMHRRALLCPALLCPALP